MLVLVHDVTANIRFYTQIMFVSQAHRGIKGSVMSSTSSEGVANAVISVEGRDKNVTTSMAGYYWRLLVPGEYTVTVTADK